MFNPCGMVMDRIRTPYRRVCRPFKDSKRTVTLRWYFAPSGAKFFPGWHRFASGDWSVKDMHWPDPGEVKEERRKWWKGEPHFPYKGQCFIGKKEWFFEGVPSSVLDFMPFPPPPKCCTELPPIVEDFVYGGEEEQPAIYPSKVRIGSGPEVVEFEDLVVEGYGSGSGSEGSGSGSGAEAMEEFFVHGPGSGPHGSGPHGSGSDGSGSGGSGSHGSGGSGSHGSGGSGGTGGTGPHGSGGSGSQGIGTAGSGSEGSGSEGSGSGGSGTAGNGSEGSGSEGSGSGSGTDGQPCCNPFVIVPLPIANLRTIDFRETNLGGSYGMSFDAVTGSYGGSFHTPDIGNWDLTVACEQATCKYFVKFSGNLHGHFVMYSSAASPPEIVFLSVRVPYRDGFGFWEGDIYLTE